MQENKEEVLEAIKKMTNCGNIQIMELDDTFGFKCQQCGLCCMNRTDIILNPFDVYKAAKYLGITTEEFIKEYTMPELGCESKIPMLVLKPGENGYCKLLKFDIKDGGKFKCAIHPAKPGACANHPIGTMTAKNVETGETTLRFIKVEQCSNSKSDEQVVVRDWVKDYTDHIDEIAKAHEIQHYVTSFFDTRKFFETLQFYAVVFKTGNALKLDLEVDPELGEKMLDSIFGIGERYIGGTIMYGYSEYDTLKPFIEQADENLRKLEELYTDLNEAYNKLTEIFVKATGEPIENLYNFVKEARNGGPINEEGEDNND